MHPSAVYRMGQEAVQVAPVVGHPVVHDAKPAGMGLARQRFVVVEGAQPRIHLVAVCARVTVVGGLGQIVGHHRRHPNAANAQVLEVVQLGRDSGQISTVAFVHLASVNPTLQLSFDVVVVFVSVRKAVGHDEVHHRRFFPSIVAVRRQGRGDVEGHRSTSASLGRELNGHLLVNGRCMEVQLHPHVAVQRRRTPCHDLHLVVVTCHVVHCAEVRAGNEHLHLTAFKVAPPPGRIHGPLRRRHQGVDSQGDGPHGERETSSWNNQQC